MTKIKQLLLKLVQRLRAWISPPVEPPRHGARTDKDLSRWANEGGAPDHSDEAAPAIER